MSVQQSKKVLLSTSVVNRQFGALERLGYIQIKRTAAIFAILGQNPAMFSAPNGRCKEAGQSRLKP